MVTTELSFCCLGFYIRREANIVGYWPVTATVAAVGCYRNNIDIGLTTVQRVVSYLWTGLQWRLNCAVNTIVAGSLRNRRVGAD